MDFQVLGPVTVLHRDRLLPIAGARQQRILAMLLSDANRVVPTTRLIDAVWQQRPPTVRSQVQIAVSRLRKSIEQPGGDRVIDTRPSGYLLRLDGGQLDSAVFRQDIAEAQALAADGALDEASARLQRALGMWRGPALAGVRDRPVLAAWADALEESRVAALDLCFRVDLRRGLHSHILGDLTKSAEEHPTHEGIHGTLMQALYLSQRQADALDVYRRMRRRLIEKAGVEPGKQLRRLEYEILSGAAEDWGARSAELN